MWNHEIKLRKFNFKIIIKAKAKPERVATGKKLSIYERRRILVELRQNNFI